MLDITWLRALLSLGATLALSLCLTTGAIANSPVTSPASPPAPHTDSLSSSRIAVDGERARVVVRCQVLSMLEVWPALDANADGEVTLPEVRLSTAPMLDYVREHYRLGVGSQGAGAASPGSGVSDPLPEAWLESVGLSVEWLSPEQVAGSGLGFELGALELSFEAKHTEGIRDLTVEVTLFQDTSPDHTDLCAVQWPDGGVAHLALDRFNPRDQSDPTGRGVLGAYFKLGLDHLLEGWDHLAFVAALFLGARGLRGLLGLVTAFTLAHSLTLAASSMGWINLARHQPLIEAIVALSIAFVALSLVFDPDSKRSRWPEAMGFGLIHGLGFAGYLSQSLVLEEARTKALLGFNMGVEVGQVAVVALLWVSLGRIVGGDEGFTVNRPTRRWGGLVLAGLGLYWFSQRV